MSNHSPASDPNSESSISTVGEWRDIAERLADALRAVMVMAYSTEPRKLEEALTWRQNDEKAQAMAVAALAEYDAAAPPAKEKGEE